jgi:DNA repair protein RecO
VRAARHAALDLDRYAYSIYVVELIDSMVVGREAEPHVFDLVEEVLALIDSPAKASPTPEWLRHFEVRLLGLSGLEPQLESCGRCGLPASSFRDSLRFNPRTGSLTCAPCSDGAGIRLSMPAATAILGLRRGPAADVAPLPSPLGAEVRVALQTFIQYHLHHPLKSPAILRDLLSL